jgi:hypothetical protein
LAASHRQSPMAEWSSPDRKMAPSRRRQPKSVTQATFRSAERLGQPRAARAQGSSWLDPAGSRDLVAPVSKRLGGMPDRRGGASQRRIA